MKKLFSIIFFSFTLILLAGNIEKYNGTTYDCDPAWHNKDFTGRDLSKETIGSGTIVFGSCFSQETPDRHIFKDSMTGVTFVSCNLDNVFIPNGNTVVNCSQRRFKVNPADGFDWLIDAQGNFTQRADQ